MGPRRSTTSSPPPAMDRRLRHRNPPRAEERLHRFLRPGALAQLRDSKIVARSLRSAASAPSAVLLPPPPPAPQPPAVGAVPHFLGATMGSQYPHRKKLAAARGVVFLSPPPALAAEVFVNGFVPSSDLVAAH